MPATAEIDERLAAAAARLLAGDPPAGVLAGDARQVLVPWGPFDLLFADGGWRDPAGLATLVDPRLLSVEVVLPDRQNALLVGTRLS